MVRKMGTEEGGRGREFWEEGKYGQDFVNIQTTKG